MIVTVMALFAAQAIVPRIVPREVREAPMVLPEWPWNNRGFSLQCDVSDGTMRRGRFSLTLPDDDGLTARISGDNRYGLNTRGFVLISMSVPQAAPNVIMRVISFDAGNGAYVLVRQAFEHGRLQSTSFAARHTPESGGIPNTEQVLGYCSPSNKVSEAGQ